MSCAVCAPLAYEYSVRARRQIELDGLQGGKYSDERHILRLLRVERRLKVHVNLGLYYVSGRWIVDTRSMIKAKAKATPSLLEGSWMLP